MAKRTLLVEIDDSTTEADLLPHQLEAYTTMARQSLIGALGIGQGKTISVRTFNGPSLEERVASLSTMDERIIDRMIVGDRLRDPEEIREMVSQYDMGSAVHEDSTEALDRLIEDARERLGATVADPVMAAFERHGVEPGTDDDMEP